MSRLAMILGGIVFVASLAYVGMTRLREPGDMLAHFRLHAAQRLGYALAEPVQLLARPRVVLERAVIHGNDVASDDTGSEGLARSRRLVLDRPVISVDVASTAARGEAALATVLEPIVSKIISLDVQSLTIRGGTLKLQSGAGEPDVLTEVDMQITPLRRTSANLSGTMTYLGERLNLAATVTRPAAQGNDHLWPVQAAVSGGLFEARFDGRLGDEKGLRLNGTVDVSIPRLREIALWIGIGAPRTGHLEGVRLRGAVDWTGGTMAFSQATLALDGNEGVGAISVTRSGSRTGLEGTLAFKQLDLKPYMVSTMVERTLLAPIFAATRPPAIAALLDNVDADLRISSETLLVPGMETGQAAVAITLKNGKLLADVAEVAIEEGVFRGQLAVERAGSDPRYILGGKFEGVEAGRLLQRVLGRNPLQGRADINLSLTTVGDSTDELLASLGGKAQIEMRGASRLGLDLRGLAQSAKRGTQNAWQTASASMTALDELALRLDAQQGVLRVTTLQAKSAASTFSGRGTIDIPRQALDFALRIGASDPASRPAMGDVVLLSGPWSAPRVALGRHDEAQERAGSSLEPITAPVSPAWQ